MLLSLGLFPAAHARELTPQQVAPDVYAIIGKREALARANRGDISNCGFIVGTTGVIVIDPGPNYAHAELLLSAIRKITLKPVVLVIDTHPHPENVLGNDAFARRGVNILAHSQTLQAMRMRCEKCYENMLTVLGEKIMAGTEIALPNMTVDESSDMTVAGRELSLLYYGWGHTEGDLAVLDRASGVLFGGGLVSLDSIPVLQQAKTKGWINAIKQLQRQPIKKLVPGNGPVSKPERLQETLDYLQSLLDLVERQFNAGMSVLDLLKQAGLPAYRKWALYSDQHPLNVQHVYSELEKEELEK
ncbi:MAG TPA: MBL fold metallo-hydrolase [Burkholderiales bacterium]|nr:MBL fold metallo-hydrolase [Burkholderiales bacterium]